MLTDMPYKIVNAVTSNIPLYFMINLRREPGQCPLCVFMLAADQQDLSSSTSSSASSAHLPCRASSD
jgi:hypothetical protein